MTKTNKKCNDCGACGHVDGKIAAIETTVTPIHEACKEAAKKYVEKETLDYGFYSRVLQKPFDSLSALKAAEEAYYSEQKAKADKAAQKKADAQKVEDAFKALNAARKEYKEKLTQLTTEYSEALTDLKKAFDLGKADIHNTLAAAEDAYSKALKEFTDKYENYHMTLKDSDFETTISKQTSGDIKPSADLTTLADLFNTMFNF